MGRRLRVGELVSHPGERGREAAGLVVEIRRTDCRVLDLEAGRSYWMPHAHLRRGATVVRRGSATSLLSSLVLYLDGMDLEAERREDGTYRAQISCAELDAAAIDGVRGYFGPGLRSLRVAPAGLARLHLVVEFLPTPEG